jgi:hypothetical protein
MVTAEQKLPELSSNQEAINVVPGDENLDDSESTASKRMQTLRNRKKSAKGRP